MRRQEFLLSCDDPYVAGVAELAESARGSVCTRQEAQNGVLDWCMGDV